MRIRQEFRIGDWARALRNQLPVFPTRGRAGFPVVSVMFPVSLTLRVLIVDDNRDAADSLGELLRLYGADVRICYDSAEALALRDFEFDVAVLDINMPGTDGCELAKLLRATIPDRRILFVALTGFGDDASRRRTAEAGFDLHLTKTVAPDVIVAALVAFAQWLAEQRAPSNGTPSA